MTIEVTSTILKTVVDKKAKNCEGVQQSGYTREETMRIKFQTRWQTSTTLKFTRSRYQRGKSLEQLTCFFFIYRKG